MGIDSIVLMLITALVGFGLAFYFERKITKSLQTIGQKIWLAIGGASFGYGLMGMLNEFFVIPYAGLLNTSYTKIYSYGFINSLVIPALCGFAIWTLQMVNRSKNSTNGAQSSWGTETTSRRANNNQPNQDSFAYRKGGRGIDNGFFVNDESLYEQAYDEYHSGKRKKGLYLKLLTNNDGIQDRAEYEYIRVRVEEFKDEIKNNRFNKQSQLKTLSEEERNSLEKIFSSNFTEGYIEGLKCLLLDTGEAAIEVAKGKYRIYEDEDSMRKSAVYHRSMGQYLATGFVKTINLEEVKNTKKTTTLTCRKCAQKFRVKNETKMVECSNCGRKWLHEQS